MIAKEEATRFLGSTGECHQIQRDLLLREILHPNATSEYGERHRFDLIDAIDAYRGAVPLTTYEDLRPAVERMARGEQNVLSTDRMVAFFKTSGSLSAPKLIPVTSSLVRQKARAFGVYWELVYRDHPALRTGPLIATLGESGRVDRTEGGREVVSESAFWSRRMQGFRDSARRPIPRELRDVGDPAQRHYVAARLGLQAPITGIMCLNPSTLWRLCRSIGQHRDELVEGLASGTWGIEWEDPVPAELEARLRRAPEAADRLRRWTREGLGGVWPELELVMSWRSDLVRPYLDQLQPLLEGIPHRDFVTQSSECMIAVPVSDASSGGLLAYTSHFFEFIPLTEVEETDPSTRCTHELEAGDYEVVVSTGGGLFRYRTGDMVRVTPGRDEVPHVEFLYRLGKTSSMTGEKLTEHQVLDAAQRAGHDLDLGPQEFLCFPRSGDHPHYGVLMTWSHAVDQADVVRRWLHALDSHLQSVNHEYAAKRASHRLGAPVGIVLADDGFDRYRAACRTDGVADDQLKTGALTGRRDVEIGLPIRASIPCE